MLRTNRFTVITVIASHINAESQGLGVAASRRCDDAGWEDLCDDCEDSGCCSSGAGAWGGVFEFDRGPPAGGASDVGSDCESGFESGFESGVGESGVGKRGGWSVISTSPATSAANQIKSDRHTPDRY
ncbi:MAG: hypothetical protein QNL96_10760 [SAR86 cluster bacterium]